MDAFKIKRKSDMLNGLTNKFKPYVQLPPPSKQNSSSSEVRDRASYASDAEK